jgi:hypothetical protein
MTTDSEWPSSENPRSEYTRPAEDPDQLSVYVKPEIFKLLWDNKNKGSRLDIKKL